MSDLVSEPQGDKLGVEAEAKGLRIGHPREVLETDEGDTTPVDHQLAGVRTADTDHEDDVVIHVDLK